MIRLVETLNFRCLRYIRQQLENFHVLVGPNASGKTTFLDVISLLGQVVSDGVENAIRDRTQNFSDLLWSGQGDFFDLAVEASIPEEKKDLLKKGFDTIRYEIRIGYHQETRQIGILEERALLKKSKSEEPVQPTFFQGSRRLRMAFSAERLSMEKERY